MRRIFIKRHIDGLNKELTTFNEDAWRAAYESRRQKEPSTFSNYAQRRPIGIADVTKEHKIASRETYKGNKEKIPSTFFNYGERHSIEIKRCNNEKK